MRDTLESLTSVESIFGCEVVYMEPSRTWDPMRTSYSMQGNFTTKIEIYHPHLNSLLINWLVVYNYSLCISSTIRFRRPITFLLPFIIRTKLIWWDSRSLYFEQRIESLTDGFIKAIAYSRSTIVNSDAELLLEKYMKTHGKGKNEITKPELREDVKAWLDFVSMNSKFLAEERIVSE